MSLSQNIVMVLLILFNYSSIRNLQNLQIYFVLKIIFNKTSYINRKINIAFYYAHMYRKLIIPIFIDTKVHKMLLYEGKSYI